MKNIFLKSTLILLLGISASKVLAFLIKIILVRTIGDGINIYSLIMPTYSLLIAITQLGLPYAISCIMAKNNNRGIHIFASIIPIALLFNIVIIALIYVFAPVLSNNLLKNPDTYYPIISISFVLPFTSISGIIKGYYFGKQNMLPNSISNIVEQLARLILLITIVPILLKHSVIAAVSGYVIISAVSELAQIIIYLFFAPKNLSFTLSDLKIRIPLMNEILSISIPSLSGRLIGNICYFFEPIILTNILVFVGYSTNFIASEYAVYNAYVIPILTMPTFFSMAINTTLIPEVSKNYKNKEYIRKLLKKCVSISLLVGVIYCTFLFFKSDLILNVLYNTNKGIDYIKLLAIFFPLFYIEGPLTSALQGLNLSKFTMKTTLKGCIIKIIVLSILSFFSIGIYGLIIAEIIDILIVNYLNTKKLHELKYI
ncbi:MAG: oligosaccharide flippase family protein [Erysipelotrichales bacterium]|nr:oligosaccharide flippase family protein [Erysipelotrichales bacterium]